MSPAMSPAVVVGVVLALAVVTALVVTALVITVASPVVAAASGLAIGLLVVAAVIDARDRRLPDSILAAAAVPVATAALIVGQLGATVGPVRDVAVGAALAAGPIALLHLVEPAAMGFGDVKAALVLGATLGLIDPRLALVALSAAAGTAAATAVARRRAVIAFGPFLVLAGIAVLVVVALTGPVELTWR